MARGLRLPVGVDPTGRAALVEGEENNRKIIWSALSGCDNEHAWQQDIGIGERMIFDLSDPTIQTKIMRQVVRIFDDFRRQKRFKLVPETIRFKTDSVRQELDFEFKFLDLESEEEQTFRRVFTRGS